MPARRANIVTEAGICLPRPLPETGQRRAGNDEKARFYWFRRGGRVAEGGGLLNPSDTIRSPFTFKMIPRFC